MASLRATLASRAWLAVRWTLTVLLAVLLAARIDFPALRRACGSVGSMRVVASASLTLLAAAVAAWRWKRALEAAGVRVALRSLGGDIFVGAAYNLILPTSVGGDVVRAARCSRRAGSTHGVWASVVFERLMGLLALSVL